MNEIARNSIKPWIDNPQFNGLDVCCGKDKVLPTAIGVDIARGKNVNPELVGDAVDLPFKPNTMDYVVCNHGLEHLEDSVKALTEWKRILKPNGLLIVLVPDARYHNVLKSDPTHIHAFIPESLKAIFLSIGGLEILQMDTIDPQGIYISPGGGGTLGFEIIAKKTKKPVAGATKTNQIRRTLKKAVLLHKLRQLRRLIRDIIKHTLALNKYKYFQVKNTKNGVKIFYIDDFAPEHSNFYWLKNFQKFGEVKIFDIRQQNQELIAKKVMSFEPEHIHLGGSVKNNMVSSQLLYKFKQKLNCTISAFYGDASYSVYHSRLAEVVDYIYVSNKTHIKLNKKKGHSNFEYMPCPTDPDIFNHQKCKKAYDIVFIGNNNQASRLPLLEKLANNFNLKVFGNGWEGTGLNYGRPVYGRTFSKVCNKAKICLGILDNKWVKLEAYFSNRLANTLAARSFYLQRYTHGIEKVFANQKHLLWYKSEKELIELIKYYLVHETEREKIALEGQQEVYKKYTYEKSVQRILNDVKKIKLKTLAGIYAKKKGDAVI
ncbi:glycosyltransferase [candidate division WOR-3 bacterium]|nr:glycosyltransferase [candidate division WOR-3 bacterium]